MLISCRYRVSFDLKATPEERKNISQVLFLPGRKKQKKSLIQRTPPKYHWSNRENSKPAMKVEITDMEEVLESIFPTVRTKKKKALH